jgi:hypothetical protein
MGKPIVEAEAEIDKRAWTRDCYAEHALKLLQAELVESSASPRATSHLNHWASSWRSCPGTFHTGRYSASLRLQSWLAIPPS